MQIVKILLPLVKLFPLDYGVPEGLKLEIGDLVIVPFRNKDITGIVWEEGSANIPSPKLKYIKEKAPLNFRLAKLMVDFILKASSYYLCELGSSAKLVLPVDIAQKPIKVKSQELPQSFNLSILADDQQAVLKELKASSLPTIIKGVTGSGKTEIYFHLIAEYLNLGKQVLIMLPEIALSSQIIKRFINRFGFEPVIWNSSITLAQKRMTLRGIVSGSVRMVIGARSSLFLPYPDLGLIIVDEEHDNSYKQEDGILYNARDMAILRASLGGTKVVLCSATPSIETIYNSYQGKYQLIELTNRYQEASLPEITIIDMRAENLRANSWLSDPLIKAICDHLSRGEQVMLFLNRRGYSPLMLCKSCGYRFTCAACSAWLVVHKGTKRLECHHCGFVSRIHTSCPECKNDASLTVCGPGVERIKEEAELLFPNSKIAIISKDQMTKAGLVEELLHKMENKEIDILIGTQLVTKGYHFPHLTLVGVIDADLGLVGGDLRSSERTYQLLHQVGGRAGREQKKGKVYLQTYYPDNFILNTLKNGTQEEFITAELRCREEAGMPPYTKMASLLLTGKNENALEQIAKKLVSVAPGSSARILGPAKAAMSKLAGKYRYRILIIAEKKFNLQKYLSLWLDGQKIPSGIHVKVDIDPQSFF